MNKVYMVYYYENSRTTRIVDMRASRESAQELVLSLYQEGEYINFLHDLSSGLDAMAKIFDVLEDDAIEFMVKECLRHPTNFNFNILIKELEVHD